MARPFVLEWDDFTGGYFVGESAANMPPDTWRGHNVLADPNDGMLYPATAWTTVTYSAGSPTDAATSGYVAMYSNAGTCYRIYNTSTSNTANIAKFVDATVPPTGVCAVTNTAIATCSALWSSCAWNADSILITYIPSSGANNFVVYTPSTAGTSVSSIHTNLRLIARYGEFAVGVGGATPYRLYYSSAYDPTAWDSGDYYDIGGVSAIGSVVPFGDALYIGKADGWWVLTGTLGSDVVIRRATEGYPGPTGNATGQASFGYEIQTNAVGTPFGVMFTSPQMDCTAATLAGGTVRPLNYASAPTSIYNPIFTISPGLYAVGQYPGAPANTGGTYQAVWLVDMRLGRARWSKIEVPRQASVLQGHFAQQLPGPTTAYYQPLWVDKDDTLYQSVMFPTREWWGTTTTATVHLAERRRNEPFTVKALYVEVAYPAGGSQPAVTAQVEMRGFPSIDTPGRIISTSTAFAPTTTGTVPASALYHDQNLVHAVLRLTPDTVAGTSAVPVLTFSFCKVRRVWAECETTGQG